MIRFFVIFLIRYYFLYPVCIMAEMIRRSGGKKQMFVFHHIPKTAGTSINEAVENKYYVIKDYRVGWSNIKPYVINLKLLNNKFFLSGHFDYYNGCSPEERYKSDKLGFKLRKITFLRDPLDTRISLYYYLMKNKQISKDVKLEEFLLADNNYLAKHLKCSRTNWRETVDSYEFIGFVEEFDKSLSVLGELIGVELQNIKKNVGQNRTPSNQILDDVKKKFYSLNRLDYKIYNYALEKFHKES